MQEKKDYLEKFIKEQFENEAGAIEEELLASGEPPEMPGDIKERIRLKLDEQIEAYEKNLRAVGLGEESRTAVCEAGVSREEDKAAVLETVAFGEDSKVVVRGKLPRRLLVVLAAVLVFAMAGSLMAIGEPERNVQVRESEVGEREVTSIDSSDENLMVTGQEEEAYELVSQEFGTEPVRVMAILEGMRFSSMELDKVLQLAQLIYLYEDGKIVYLISTSYKNSSMGIDAEDQVIDTYHKTVKNCDIEVKEYKIGKNI